MYGFWSDGSSPAGSAPRGAAANGEETNAAIVEKNTITAPRVAVTQGRSSRLRRRFWKSTSVAAPDSTVSHRSSEPGWLAHSAVRGYGSGSLRLVVSTTTASEKSCVTSAYS